MQGSTTFTTSKTRLLIGLVFFSLLSMLLNSATGEMTTLEALGYGKLVGKFAFASVLMFLMALLFLVGLFVPFKRVTIDRDGIEEVEFGRRHSLSWSEVRSVRIGGPLLTRGVIFETSKGTVAFAQSLGQLKAVMSVIDDARKSQWGQQSVSATGFGQRQRSAVA